MRRPNRLTQTIIGLLLGVLCSTNALAVPAEITSDTSWTSWKQVVEATKQTVEQTKIVASSEMSRIEQLAEHAKNARRWLDTVAHFTKVINEDIRRFTSLKGILEVAEEKLGLDDDTLKALADIGETVRACFALKEQFESLIHTRLRMIENMYARAKRGIFNPAQDLADLDEYLRSGIGRSSARVIASRERLARLDNELETWIYDLQQARKELAYKQTQLNEILEKLKAEGGLDANIRRRTVNQTGDREGPRLRRRENASAEAIDALLMNKTLIEGQINELNKRISELLEKINERYRRYHMTFDESKARVSDIRKAVDGWQGMIEAKEKAIQEMVNPYSAPEPEP